MIRKFLFSTIIFFLLSLPLFSAENPGSDPEFKQLFDKLEIPLCGGDTGKEDHEIHFYSGFALCYRESYEQPEWVAYELLKSELEKVVSRSNNFHKDDSISTDSAFPNDYRSSGFDRGHLAPAADMSWSEESMVESFLMSNMTPQSPSFNRGIWSKLEAKVRNWAERLGRIFVVTGPVLEKDAYRTIGVNQVAVPEFFYKVILFIPDDCGYDGKSNGKDDIKDDGELDNVAKGAQDDIEGIAFIIPNEGSTGSIFDFAVTIDEAESRTGLDFFSLLEDDCENFVESEYNLSFWE